MSDKLALNGGSPIRKEPFPQWPIFNQDDEKMLIEVLHSGNWGRHAGVYVDKFEASFAEYLSSPYCIAVMNGSVALRIALMAAGIQAGDEVIVPAYTFIATASSVIEVNAVPIFVDIDPQTYCLSLKEVEEAITERTRAIIPVHFAGQAVDMDALINIARKNNLIVIEDAAHAHGAEYKGQMLGTIGELGCFSFQSSKNLTAGEGGAIVTNNDHFERICRSLHTCGRFPESAWYEHYLPGGNYRMTEFQAGMLLSQLERLDEQTRIRDYNGQYLNRKLADIPGIHPLKRGFGETRHSYHLYIFRYVSEEFDGLSRERFLEALSAEGIPNLAGYGKPLYQQELFKNLEFGPFTGYRLYNPDLNYQDIQLPVTEQACFHEACWIPQSVLLGTEQDMDDIVNAIIKIYTNRGELIQ
jgi:dTDP-4-amino-4,6-dideoxygalactose transaminase